MVQPSIALTRRELLGGIAAGVSAGLLGDGWRPERDEPGEASAGGQSSEPSFAPERAPDYYPPARIGFRGDHEGSFSSAHDLRKGTSWRGLRRQQGVREHYDLVVVGGGISGLAAAYFYRQRVGDGAKILVLENHDDFGGHATRNEFNVGGRLLITYGGSQSLASPGGFSEISKRLMQELGVDMQVFHEAYDHKLHVRRGTALFFDRETFGQDRLLLRMYETPWSSFLAKAPLSQSIRRDIVRVFTEKRDYLEGMSLDAKKALLCKISYAEYLTQYCKLAPEALALFQTFPHDLFAVGIDGVSAWSCYHGADDFGAFVYPGFDGLGLPPLEPDEPYIYHFPDGNASVARLLVQSLVPAAVPGKDMHDIVLARVDYSGLDADDANVRIRLNSTVVHARHVRSASGNDEVEVAYVRGEKLCTVRASHCVLACYNSMVPYICPELPQAQRKALAYLVRMPVVYTHVALRNTKAFAKLGVRQIVSPGSYHNYTALDFPVSMGGYEYPKHSDEPAVLFMLRVPCRPGLPRRDQNRIGRWELLNTNLTTVEQKVTDQLGRMLAETGFDPTIDIAGITVNRWAHGYAFIPNRLFDPEWSDEEKPWVIGRRPFGRFAIANSDAGASAYLEVAVDQAWRAVTELVPEGAHT